MVLEEKLKNVKTDDGVMTLDHRSGKLQKPHANQKCQLILKGNNKITELQTILQRESQNS
jgi:hypothetical protein